jgi:hypothetical protein
MGGNNAALRVENAMATVKFEKFHGASDSRQPGKSTTGRRACYRRTGWCSELKVNGVSFHVEFENTGALTWPYDVYLTTIAP